MRLDGVTSASACCLECSKHKTCKYWTYGTKGECWVKTDSKGPQQQVGRESGYYDPCKDHSNFEDNTDYHGSDLVKGGFSNATPEKCCAERVFLKIHLGACRRRTPRGLFRSEGT